MKDELINMTQAWDKEISESTIGIEPMTSRKHGGRSIHLAMRTHGEQDHWQTQHITARRYRVPKRAQHVAIC